MRLRMLLAAVPACLLQAQGLEAPRWGWMNDGAGFLRPLLGLSGASTPGASAAAGVLRAASSQNWVLAQTTQEILALPGDGARPVRFPAPGGPALFAFDAAGNPAAVCFPSAGQIALWRNGGFVLADGTPPEGALAMAATAGEVLSFLVRRQAAVWRVDISPAGESSLPLPGVGAPALLLSDGTVAWGDREALHLRGPEGARRQATLPARVVGLDPLSGDWLRARLEDRQVAVSFRAPAARVVELPEVKP